MKGRHLGHVSGKTQCCGCNPRVFTSLRNRARGKTCPQNETWPLTLRQLEKRRRRGYCGAFCKRSVFLSLPPPSLKIHKHSNLFKKKVGDSDLGLQGWIHEPLAVGGCARQQWRPPTPGWRRRPGLLGGLQEPRGKALALLRIPIPGLEGPRRCSRPGAELAESKLSLFSFSSLSTALYLESPNRLRNFTKIHLLKIL